ncbi:MAG: hypothetical protein NVS4B12_02790 [Ktedonobacteraceae bacterium]
MQKLEIFIEENAYGSVRSVEVVADASVAALVPALVEELRLPQADTLGKKRVYMLRHAANGQILSEQATLLASGVTQGERLTLDSYVVDGSVASMTNDMQTSSTPDILVHSSATADDRTALPVVARTSGLMEPGPRREKHVVTRRAFLLFSGMALGAGTVGLGYAAFRSFTDKSTLNMADMMGMQQLKAQKTTIPMIPVMAKKEITFTGHQQIVRTVSWSPDGMTLASGADDAQLLLWETHGTVRHTLVHPASVHALAWSPDSQRLVTGSNNQILFLHAQSGATLFRSTRRHRAAVSSLAWAANKQQLQVVSGGADNLAIVWNTTKYGSQTIFTRHTAPVESVSWAVDGQTVASSSQGGAVRVWNAVSGQEVHPFFLDANVPMRALAFSPLDTTLAVGGDDGIVRLWNGQTCQRQAVVYGVRQCVDMPQRIHVSSTAIRSLAWSPDGKVFAVGSEDGVLSLWQAIQHQKPLLTVTVQHNTPVHSITWAPTGNQLAVAAGNNVTVWSLS